MVAVNRRFIQFSFGFGLDAQEPAPLSGMVPKTTTLPCNGLQDQPKEAHYVFYSPECCLPCRNSV
jgi:hypothetical protein